MLNPTHRSPNGLLHLLALTIGTSLCGAESFEHSIRPLLNEYCGKCHSTKEQKGDLDLERFATLADVKRDPRVWQLVEEQMVIGEMPPAKKPQPDAEQKARLLGWVRGTLREIALANAGDPGPVVLRRLSNAEYTYTLRDITGVSSLDPAREFPVDGAAGEGFSNVGHALVMSPGMLTKYFDAAKDIASHAVLLPDGLRFSEATTRRDATNELLGRIREFYGRFSDTSGATKVNLQGVVFDTNGGGRLPVEAYLSATLAERGALSSGSKTIAEVASARHLNAKYLGALWTMLNTEEPSSVLDPLRKRWRAAKPEDAGSLTKDVAAWQQALWKFSSVGQLGKLGAAKKWMEPATPIIERQEVKLKLTKPADGGDVVLHLAAHNAGDGDAGDFVVWERPRLVAPGRPEMLLRDVRSVAGDFEARRVEVFGSTARCLEAAAEAGALKDKAGIADLAKRHDVDANALVAWLDFLGIGPGVSAKIESHLKRQTKNPTYDFIRGWEEKDALGVHANSSDQEVRVPGRMKPHSVAVHPSPTLAVAVGWRSPVTAAMKIEASVQHAHPECGNGVTWSLELRRGNTRQRLAGGDAQGGNVGKAGPFENFAVQTGDIVSLVISPRDGNHSCDLTALDFTLTGGGKEWSLAKDVSPDIHAGNPHADSHGNVDVWHFYSEPSSGGNVSAIPQNSLLAKWQAAARREERTKLAGELQTLLLKGAEGMPKDSPDAALYGQLASLTGPLFSRGQNAGTKRTSDVESKWGLASSAFGKHPSGEQIDDASICVRAPSVIEVRLPTALVEGAEFVTSGALHSSGAGQGSVQLQVGEAKVEAGAPLIPGAPVVARAGSAARKRLDAAFDDFRQLFPAALCYAKIVPVDEVITLTLYHREDDALCRLMLDDAQKAELDRMWSELRFISRDALLLVEAYDQLWQYATQDADPKVFEPLHQPILDRAASFRKQLIEAEPKQVDAVIDFAPKAWRRPLSDAEKADLRSLYQKLRAEELPHEDALRLTLARVFVAPAFLYKMEEPGAGSEVVAVDDWELATRLSYFLWSTAPDAELAALAAAGELRKPDVLLAQTRRMLKDERVRRLATEFGSHWLHTYGFDTLDEKNERLFPAFAALRGAMNEEPVRFVTDLFQNNGSVIGLIEADHTFVNGALAKHYGIEGVSGDEWRKVDGMRKRGRGGVLGFAAALAKQSGASRTSPILRGNWLSEVLLGEKLPRPPKGVPILPDEPGTSELTVRQMVERHTNDENCSGCHSRIDPFGFALERFDAIGRFREKDEGGHAIDTRVKLKDGTEFDGIDGLRNYLLTTRRDAFVHQFCRKLLGYALGRGVQLSDQPLLEEIEAGLAANDWRIGQVVEKIVTSKQFREIRGRSAVVSE